MNDSGAAGFCLVVFLIGMVLLGIIAANQTGSIEGREAIQQEAIKRGYAEYDAKTGEWKWKGDAEE